MARWLFLRFLVVFLFAAPRLPKPAKKVVVAKKAPRPIIVPKVGISIGSGGGLGLSLGF